LLYTQIEPVFLKVRAELLAPRRAVRSGRTEVKEEV